jgi:hypothetical protein
MSVEVGQEILAAGDDGCGRFVLRNTGTERIGPLHCGQPLAGSLLNSSREKVGGYCGWIAGVGRIEVRMRLHHGPGAPATTTQAAPLRQITIIPRDAGPGKDG